jgi:hypothetical protein
MSNKQKGADMRQIWQGQAVEGAFMTLDELRSALAKLNRVERARTVGSGLVCLLFLGALSGLLIVGAPIPIVRAGECFFAIGAGFFLLQALLGLRRAPGKLLADGEPEACAVFYRSVLERQQKFYRRSAVWVPAVISACLLPVILLLPSIRIVMIALWILLVPFWIYESLGIARSSQRELEKLNASSR